MRNPLQSGKYNRLQPTSLQGDHNCKLPRSYNPQYRILHRCLHHPSSYRRSRTGPLGNHKLRRPWPSHCSCKLQCPGNLRFPIHRICHLHQHRSSKLRRSHNLIPGNCLRSRKLPRECLSRRKLHTHRRYFLRNRRAHQANLLPHKRHIHPIPRNFHRRWLLQGRSYKLFHLYNLHKM